MIYSKLGRRSFVTGTSNWKGRLRFYGDVQVVTSSHGKGYEVELDRRKLKTPGQLPFVLPSRALAGLVAQEWDSQICAIETSTMPVTMQCATAIDITPVKHPDIIEELLRYLGTDMVCFPQKIVLTEESGESMKLRDIQLRRWSEPLKHFEENYGKLKILDSDTLEKPRHDPLAITNARKRIEPLNDFELTALHHLAMGCKSLVLPLALLDRRITVQQAYEAARAEEDHQIQTWGLVEGAHDVDQESLLAQLSTSSLILWFS